MSEMLLLCSSVCERGVMPGAELRSVRGEAEAGSKVVELSK